MNSSKTKLELQKHLTTLTNQEQATIFEEVQVQCSACGFERENKAAATPCSVVCTEYTGAMSQRTGALVVEWLTAPEGPAQN